jgi:streptogramin lyase
MNRKLSWLTLAAVALILAACSSGNAPPLAVAPTPAAPVNSSTKSGTIVTGVLHGGQAPITGSTLTLFSAGVPASATPTQLGTTTTDGKGNFTFAGFTCPSSGALIYVVAAGGNAGGGVNPAIKLMAALGPCGSLPPSVVINELTTVAAVYALNAFSDIAPGGGTGLGGCVDCSPVMQADMTQLHGNSPAIDNAFGTAALLANAGSGLPANFLPPSTSCAAGVSGAPVNCSALSKLTALGNSVAACVNSAGSSPQCTGLFDCAVAGATLNGGPASQSCAAPTGSTAPIDTLESILSIARNAGIVSIAGVYNLSTRNAVFSPGLSATPTDWTIAVNFIGGVSPIGVAIDGSGNVWVTDDANGVLELSPTGSLVSPTTGFTGGGLSGPIAIAIDASGNVWVANRGGSVSEFRPNGSALSPSTGFTGGGINQPNGIAIDASGNAWVANLGNGSVSELSPNGSALSPSTGFTGGGLAGPAQIAIDASGNVWVTDNTVNGVSELSPSGSPLSPVRFSGGGISEPSGIAIDGGGNVWVTNRGNVSVSELSSNGSALSPSTGFTGGGIGIANGTGIAIDGSGNVWVANFANGSVSELSSNGSALSPSTGFTGGGLRTPQGIAIDGGGDVWMPNTVSNSVTEVIGVATATVTPLVAQISKPTAALVSIAVTPTTASVTDGGTQQFTATGSYADSSTKNLTGQVTWSSSNSAVASIAPSGGLATCVAPGTVSVVASLTQDGATVTGTAAQALTCSAPVVTLASIAVTPAAPDIGVGTTQQFTATGTFSDSSTKNLTSTVSWSSSNGAVATIATSGGLATGAAAGGPVTITASLTPSGQSTAVTGTAQLTVSASSTTLACNLAPSSPGGGALPYENQSYCISFSGQTDQLYNFTGTLTFTTPLAAGNVIACRYATSGTISTATTPVSTGPTACTGTIDAAGNVKIQDASGNGFSGSFATNGSTVSGTYNFSNFGPGGGVATGPITGTEVP